MVGTFLNPPAAQEAEMALVAMTTADTVDYVSDLDPCKKKVTKEAVAAGTVSPSRSLPARPSSSSRASTSF